MAKKPIPDNAKGFIPYLIVKNAKEAVGFYEKAFNGKRGICINMKDGSVGHAEVIVGDTTIMLAEERPEWNVQGPLSLGGCPITLTLYVEDVDKAAETVTNAGMKVKKPVENQFYGDRMGTFTDPYGYEWCLGTHIEDVTPEDMQKKMNEMYG